MSNSWLPRWLDVACTVAFLVIVVAHAGHAVGVRGRSRPWHGVHVLMALGMLDMFWPADEMPVGAGPGEATFAVAAVGALAATAWFSRGGRGVSWPWLVAAVDLGVMAAMFELMDSRNALVTVLLAAWCVVEAAGWASGRLSAVAQREALSMAAGEGADVDGGHPVEGADLGHGAAAVEGAAEPRATVLTARRHGTYALTVRLSLVVMALGMAYMLLAMQYGTVAMPMPSHPMPMPMPM